jgi:hypothetical protein
MAAIPETGLEPGDLSALTPSATVAASTITAAAPAASVRTGGKG